MWDVWARLLEWYGNATPIPNIMLTYISHNRDKHYLYNMNTQIIMTRQHQVVYSRASFFKDPAKSQSRET